MERSQIVDAYIGRVLELRREREGSGVSREELEQIAFESGFSREDLEMAREEMGKAITRGRAFLSYGNWGRAVEEFQQGVALDPNNAGNLILLAHALWNHSVAEEDEVGQYRAMQYAERGIQIDPANGAGVKLVTHMTEHPGEPYGGPVRRRSSGDGVTPDPRAKRIIALAVAAALLVMGMALAVFFVADDQGVEVLEGELRREATHWEKSSEPPFATEVARFGKEGTGAGYFEDARSIGLDAAGNFYVGEYASGRVQVLDPDGNWLREWTPPGENSLRALDVSRDGTVYAVRDRRILRVDGRTGEVLGQVEYEGGDGFDDVYVLRNGGIVGSWRGMRYGDGGPEGLSEDIVVFGPDLAVEKIMVDPLAGIAERHHTPRVAVAGEGTIYALDMIEDVVYIFTPAGTYRTSFGESGDEPGQFRAAHDIAITNRGDVLVSDAKGIQVFSENGRYKGLIDVDGVASGMAVDQNDVIWVAVRDGVRGMVIGGE